MKKRLINLAKVTVVFIVGLLTEIALYGSIIYLAYNALRPVTHLPFMTWWQSAMIYLLLWVIKNHRKE